MKYSFIYFILLFSLGTLYSQEAPKLRANINIYRHDIYVNIEAVVENNDHIFNNKLNYILLSLKRKGTSNNYQKDNRFGEFSLFPNEKKIITTLKLNIEKDQELKIYLFIKNKDQLIAQDSIKINEINKMLKTSSLRETEIEIKGLVIENVKTKMGRDFYDFFYQKYNSSGAKYSSIIQINEKPSLGGRGSLVTVEMDNDKIFEFQARPDEELLRNAAVYSLKLIENYSKNKKTIKKNLY